MNNCPVAQLAERLTLTQEVLGSIPSGVAISSPRKQAIEVKALFNGACSVVVCTSGCDPGSTGSIPVEHPTSLRIVNLVDGLIRSQEVAGSNPAAETKMKLALFGYCP